MLEAKKVWAPLHSRNIKLCSENVQRTSCYTDKCAFVFSDPMSQSDREKMAVGTAGMALGSVFLAVGVIYYLCNKNGKKRKEKCLYSTKNTSKFLKLVKLEFT